MVVHKVKKFRKLKRVALALVFSLIIFCSIISSLVWYFENEYANKYYPGILIAGEPVGGRTYDSVLNEFKKKSDTLLKNGLNLEFEKQNGKMEINIPAATTGLTSDILVEYFSVDNLERNLSAAYDWGRQGPFMQRLKEQLELKADKNFDSSITGHRDAILSLLSRETKYILTAGVPAQFFLDKNGEVAIITEKLGDNADVENIADSVIQKFSTFEVQPVIFKMKPEIPYPTAEKLKPLLDLAKEFAKSTSVIFRYQNHKWNISNKTFVNWLTLKPNDGITIDSNKLEAFLSQSVAPFINDPPENSRFQMKDGNLIEISPAKSGESVDTDKIIALMEKNISQIQKSFSDAKSVSADNIIDIPIETIVMDPKVTQKTIDQYKIKDLIGYARTNFTGGSSNRQHNIEVGVSKLTGILIAPGEEFSTVWNIGEVTEKAGFVKEYVINGNQTVKELGGGLCQLATTLFRMALNAGLPITERVNHKYVISYYGPGLDATIYGPHPDFRFVNDTGNYILLQGTAKNDEVIFELYGTNDLRVAKVSEPVLSNEKPVPKTRYIMSYDIPSGKTSCQTATHKGITADTTYTVSYPDGSKKEEVFHSVYEAWPKVCVIGI